MYLGRPGYRFNGGCTMLRQEILETTEDKDNDTVTVKTIVLALTSEYVSQHFVTWVRWVTFEADADGIHRLQTVESCSYGHYYRQLTEAMADYESRLEDFTHTKRDEEAIRQRGHDDGVAAASWIVDGNTEDPYKILSDLVQGIEDGDPGVHDCLPDYRVNGEFADDKNWEEICMEEVEHYGDDGEAHLYDVYCDAFDTGVEDEIRRMQIAYQPADWSGKA
jgi:hypothetical protein